MRHKHVITIALLAFAGIAAPASAATDTTASKCVTVIEGGDMGERFCVDDGECLVAEYRTTFLGTERYCTVRRPLGATGVETSAPGTRCYTQSYGEFGSKYCVSTEGSCLVYSYTWGGVEGTYTCHVPRP